MLRAPSIFVWLLLLTHSSVSAQDTVARWPPAPAPQHSSTSTATKQIPWAGGTGPGPAIDTVGRIELTLDDVLSVARRHNPGLSVAAAHVNAARGQQLQAGLYPNPVLGYHATEINNLGTAGQQGGFVRQEFITAGKLRLDQLAGGQAVTAQSANWQAARQRVESDVRLRFYEALVAQRRVELTQELTRIGQELVDATEQLVDGGVGTPNDLLQAEIRADESRILHENALNQQLESWRRLAAVMGVPQLSSTRLAGDLTPPAGELDWEQSCQLVLDQHPEVQAARARVGEARLRLLRARREPIPNIDVMLSVRHHNVSDSDVANVQLGVPLPVFNRNQGNITAAESSWVAASQEVRRVELRLRDQLAQAYRRYANARQQVERYGERMVPRAAESLRLVSAAYEQGQSQYLTLLNAQQTFVQVNLSYVDSLRDLWLATVLIEGQLLSESLRGE